MASASSTDVGSGVPDHDHLQAEVATVLVSRAFRRSPKISRLLSYLCDKELSGKSGEVTEYGIALEVLGRSADFDPQQDAVVRVDTHHLRKKLKEYYSGEGSGHEVQIVIPSGQYIPQFVRPGEVPRTGWIADGTGGTATGEAGTWAVEVVHPIDSGGLGRGLGNLALPA